jgi:hypothetical protein
MFILIKITPPPPPPLTKAGCIPPEMIIQRLTIELLKKLDDR